MADLANPVVGVVYSCGCLFLDDTEIGGGMRFVWVADETRTFKVKQSLAGAKTDEAKIAIMNAELSRITDSRKPSRAELEAKASPDDVYAALLGRAASEVKQSTDGGVRVPAPPAVCPRHVLQSFSVHASYLNPNDVIPAIDEAGTVGGAR